LGVNQVISDRLKKYYMKTPQDLQNEFNKGVMKALSDLIILSETSAKSKQILYDFIELNSKRIEDQDKLIDILMSERSGRLN